MPALQALAQMRPVVLPDGHAVLALVGVTGGRGRIGGGVETDLGEFGTPTRRGRRLRPGLGGAGTTS